MTINQQGRPATPSEAAQDLLSLCVGPLPGPEELRREIAEAFVTERLRPKGSLEIQKELK